MSTPRTSKADKNYLSGTPEGWTLYAGTDHAAPTLPPPIDGAIIEAPELGGYDAILKLSRCTNLCFTNLRVSQGLENSLDQNSQCRNISLHGDFGVGSVVGDQIITTKGGCTGITYSGILWSRGKKGCEICVGNWSDQSYDRSTDLDYSGLVHSDGQPIRFILSRCARVKLPPNAKVLRWKSLLQNAYWWAKWCAVKVGLFGS